MESHEFNPTVIDRNVESDKIKADINNTEQNKVHIIFAKTAVGKSTLSKKVSDSYCTDDRHTIVVRTNPENSTTNSTEWTYIDQIFECIDKSFSSLYEKKDLSFNKYIHRSKDKHLKKMIYENIADQVFASKSKWQLLLVPFYYKIKKLMKIGEFNPHKYLEQNTMNTRLLKTRYIHHVLSSIDVLLVIDNIQNIDNMSWKYLLDWLNETKTRRHYIILEYTISDNLSVEPVLRRAEQIRATGTLVVYSKLEKLPAEYAIDVINQHFPNKPNDLDFNINLLNRYKADPEGNLRQLIDFTIGYTPEKHNETNPTLENILHLNDAEKYILAVLIYCNGTLDLNLLYSLCMETNLDRRSADAALSKLKQNRQVKINDNRVFIYHASIIDQWRKNIPLVEEFDQLAYIKMEHFFSRSLQKNSNNEEYDYAWLTLINLYSKNSPKKIESLLDKLIKGAINCISPENIWRCIKLLIDSTKDNIQEFSNLYYKILCMCFEMEIYEEGYSCLLLMEKVLDINQHNALLLHKSMYLSALDRHQENINLYNIHIHHIKKDSRTYFHLKMIVLCSFRSLNNFPQCIGIHKEIMSKRWKMAQVDYCYFLRLTNVYLPDNKALPYAKRSMKEFHKLNCPVQEAKSMITYSKLLSGLGKDKKAIKLIKKAERLLHDRQVGKHMIYVNLAAFLLMQGHNGEDIWFLLDQAECSAVVPYDRLGIIVNKLAWCYENHRYDLLDLLINQAEELMQYEPDEHVHVLIYYNLFLLFRDSGHTGKATEFYQKAYEKRAKCKFVQARIEGTKNSEMHYRLKHPWHVCYLSFWTYDLNEDMSFW